MKIEIVEDGAWTTEKVAQVVEQVHQAARDGETISVPNPHYAGLIFPPHLVAPLMARAAKENLTPTELLTKITEEYLVSQ